MVLGFDGIGKGRGGTGQGLVSLGFGVPTWSFAGFHVNPLFMKFLPAGNGQVSAARA